MNWDGYFKPRRVLGRTGFVATQLGVGDIADRSQPIESCVATLVRALNAGLNVIDTAPGYEDGFSEEIVGRALAGRRDEVFLIDKIDEIDQPVEFQVHSSLERLKLQCVDCFVIHGLSDLESWETAIASNGAMTALHRLAGSGAFRFCGISSHHPEVLRRGITSGLCDLVMFAVGPFADGRYTREILPMAREHNVGTVCFKTFGAGKLLGDTMGYSQPLTTRPRGKLSSGGVDKTGSPELPHLSVDQCLHYTLTHDPDVALLGLSYSNEQDAAFASYDRFAPMAAEVLEKIEQLAQAAVVEKGPCWWNPQEAVSAG